MMNTHDNDRSGLAVAGWRKASYSNGNGGNCVEVADLGGGHRAVRDSKNPTGPALTCSAAHWAVFTAGIRTGVFD
ncbi:MAG: DUF397 domain-containing protein [Pseudonocardiaceae bacterium]